MKETYFQGYRDALDPVFKDPRGRICQYTDMKQKVVYGRPYYDEEANRRLNIEAKKFLFRSNSDWNNVKKIITDINRLPVSVSFNKYMYKLCINIYKHNICINIYILNNV